MRTYEPKVKSLQKALTILNAFTREPQLGVTEISEKFGLNKSNTYNILSTFCAMDYLEKDELTGKYKLGFGVFSLCQSVGDNMNIRKIAMPFMQEIADLTGEMVYLAVPHGDEVIYLEAMYPVNAFNRMREIIGEHARMYCTGIGKAMLACLPEAERDEYLCRPLERFTENTITEKEALRREMKLTRSRGYSIDNMEHEYGIKCVGMAILDRRGRVEAGISVSGPSLRFSDERIARIVEIMSQRVDKIRERMDMR
jgi:IclR family KDG regulon transcriptional repressor